MKEPKHTEEEMVALADARTYTAESEAESAALKAWRDMADGELGTRRDGSWAESGIFKTVLDYIESRRKDLACGYCSPYAFTAGESLFKVLAQDFGYVFERYEWNGRTFDPDQPDAFDLLPDRDCLEPLTSLKEEVVKAFETYLTEGAARAKAIGSDAYLMWRRALMDCVFVHHRFSFGCQQETLEAYLNDIQKAAQVTWADQQIFDQMEQMKKVSCHKRAGAKKRVKKPRKPRGEGGMYDS